MNWKTAKKVNQKRGTNPRETEDKKRKYIENIEKFSNVSLLSCILHVWLPESGDKQSIKKVSICEIMAENFPELNNT